MSYKNRYISRLGAGFDTNFPSINFLERQSDFQQGGGEQAKDCRAKKFIQTVDISTLN